MGRRRGKGRQKSFLEEWRGGREGQDSSKVGKFVGGVEEDDGEEEWRESPDWRGVNDGGMVFGE